LFRGWIRIREMTRARGGGGGGDDELDDDEVEDDDDENPNAVWPTGRRFIVRLTNGPRAPARVIHSSPDALPNHQSVAGALGATAIADTSLPNADVASMAAVAGGMGGVHRSGNPPCAPTSTWLLRTSSIIPTNGN
jgi:hypothetical protein